MAIQVPRLDDRSYDDLVKELVDRIPAHTPEWTNPQPGDPGRTLIELFAWLGDSLLYRANLIPERQRLVFLRLLGVQTRPQVAARGIITIAPGNEDQTDAVVIRPLAKVDGPVPFETLTETTILPISAEIFYKRPLTESETNNMTDVIQGLQSIYPISGKAVPYETTPLFANGQPDPEGFNLKEQSLDNSLWIAILASKAELKADVRDTLGQSENGTQQLLSVGIAPTITVPGLFEEIGPRAKIPHLWQMTGVDEAGKVVYYDLDTLLDSTGGLTQQGIQRLALPAANNIGAPTNDVRRNVTAGVGEQPPRLDDEKKSERLITWLRLRPSKQDVNIDLSWVGLNAVEIDQRQTINGRIIGQSDGSADQKFFISQDAVEQKTLKIQVEEEGLGYKTWSLTEDLALHGRDARVFELHENEITFGDNIRGKIPDSGSRIRVEFMRVGGGSAGNLAPGSLTGMTAVNLKNKQITDLIISQSLPTTGGENAETLDEAEKRIPVMLQHRERAVTAADYKELAAETPGVRLGRVEVMPRFKPHQKRNDVVGVVSVMVLPFKPVINHPNPRPDRPILEKVHAHLDERRPLGTELYTIGCEYIPIGISVGVTLADGVNREEVLLAVREALKETLWPLAPGGPVQTGWPLGRSVRDRELEVAVSRVEGIREVAPLNLFKRNLEQNKWQLVKRSKSEQEPVEIKLEPWQLPELLSVLVTDDGAAPKDLDRLPNPFANENEVGVPVVPEVC